MPGALAALARFSVRHRYWVLVIAAVATISAFAVGRDVAAKLAFGGWISPDAESRQADALLGRLFPDSVPNLVLVARAPGSVDDPAAEAAGRRLTERLAAEADTIGVDSYWNRRDPTLRSHDGRAGLVVARVTGAEPEIPVRAHEIGERLAGTEGPLTVTYAGEAPIWWEVGEQSAEDLHRAELLAVPAVLIGLLLVFGGPLAALLPLLVGVVSVAGTIALLHTLAELTTVSVLALNITTALGFALALDYSLFVVSRYREELAAGRPVGEAIQQSMRTAGRTVLFSAVTVMLSLAGLLVFPLFLFRSLAYAGICVVGLAAVATLLVLPAALALLGHRVTRFDPFHRVRRLWSAGPSNWHRLAMAVMRHPVLVAVPVTLLLLVLALPFRHASFTLGDERVLPASSQMYQTMQMIRDDFGYGVTMEQKIVLDGLDPVADSAALEEYALRVSQVPAVRDVATATGLYEDGRRLTPLCLHSGADPPACTVLGRFVKPGATWVYVRGTAPPDSQASQDAVRVVRDLPSPVPSLVAGPTADLVDAKHTIGRGLPWAVGIVVLAALVLLFLFTGSVFIPVKAVVVNLLSLTAAFGAIVYIFQEGHMKWLVGDFIVTGSTILVMPILLFCIAFGLSMDYECLLLSRICEEHERTGETMHATAAGLERTARLFTAAAVLAAIVMACLATSRLVLLKLFGVGLLLAILIDATLIRCLLVPALMRIAGRVNWWAPKPLRRVRAAVERHTGE